MKLLLTPDGTLSANTNNVRSLFWNVDSVRECWMFFICIQIPDVLILDIDHHLFIWDSSTHFRYIPNISIFAWLWLQVNFSEFSHRYVLMVICGKLIWKHLQHLEYLWNFEYVCYVLLFLCNWHFQFYSAAHFFHFEIYKLN